MITARNLRKTYGPIEAVRDVSFSVATGEVAGFLGANGAGKTTTIRLLATALAPESGSAQVGGFDIISHGDQVRRSLGYLPETPPLYRDMRVDEYLTFVARAKGVRSKEIRDAVDHAVEICGLKELRKRLCGHLSTGFRQRTGIAQALIHNPPVIILDEPTNGLDPKQTIQMRELIGSLAGKHTVLLSTHLLHEVQMVCSKAIFIHAGKVVLQKQISELPSVKNLEEIFLEVVSSA